MKGIVFQEGRVGQLCWMLLRVIFPRKPVSVTLLITNLTSASKKESKVLIMESQASHVLLPVYLPRLLSPAVPYRWSLCCVWPLWTLTNMYHLLSLHSSPRIAAFVWRCAPLPPFQSMWFWVTRAALGMGHATRSTLIKCFTLSWQGLGSGGDRRGDLRWSHQSEFPRSSGAKAHLPFQWLTVAQTRPRECWQNWEHG